VKDLFSNDLTLLQRPVQWLLWSRQSEEALLLSPEEVELIIPILRNEKDARVHLLSYAAPVTRKMLHFNNLAYYAIPALPNDYKVPGWLPIEVGFFAGRIYFEWHEYEGILSFLGLKPAASPDSSGSDTTLVEGANDGQPHYTFTKKPLAFLQDWISARRKMQDWSASPMGFIVAGKKLYANHPFFTTVSSACAKDQKIVFVERSEENVQEEGSDDDDVFYDANDHVMGGPDGEDWDDRKSANGE
jgi:hypothetical protein